MRIDSMAILIYKQIKCFVMLSKPFQCKFETSQCTSPRVTDMPLLLLFIVAIVGFKMDTEDHVSEISDCLFAISVKYLNNRCLAFLFPLNFSDPSVAKAPPLVRSTLLKDIHGGWSPTLPAVNTEDMHIPYLKPDLGPIRYLQCAHIIILHANLSYVDQVYYMMYTFYSHYYKHGGGEDTKMVVAVSETVEKSRIYDLLFYMYKMGDIDVIFVGVQNGIVTIFSFFPFGENGYGCPEDNFEIQILDTWVNGSFLKAKALFHEKVPRKFNNCSIKVGTVHHPPNFVMDSNGEAIGGIELWLIETICEHLGLRIDYVSYNGTDNWFWMEDGEPRGITVDLRRGDLWLVVSGNNNFVFTFSCTFVPHSFMIEHHSWYFRYPETVPNWTLIFAGFDRLLWISVIVAIVAFPYCIFLLAKLERGSQPFERLSTAMLSSCGLVVSHSSSEEPRSNVIRIAFASWLFYSIHINLAYSATLTSLLTTGKTESKIRSFQEILDRNIKTVMSQNTFYQTMAIDEPTIKKVLSNRIVSEDYEEFYPQLKKWGNISFLQLDISFVDKIKRDNLVVYNSGLNIGFVYIGIKLRRNHFFVERIADLSSRVFEAGFTSQLIEDYTKIPKNYRGSELKPFSLIDLAGPFFILLTGCAVSVLLFIAEVVKNLLQNSDEET